MSPSPTSKSMVPKASVIHPYKAVFFDHALETKYLLESWQKVYWIMMIGFAIGYGMELAVMLINLNAGIGDAVSTPALVVRIAMLSVGYLLLLMALRYPKSLKSLALIGLVGAVLMLGKMGIMWFLPRLDGVGSVNLIGSILFIYLLFPFTFLQKVLVALVFTTGVLVGWVLNTTAATEIYYFSFWAIMTNIIGIVVSYRRQTDERYSMFQQLSLEESVRQEQRLLQHNAAMNDMLTHELRTPFANIQHELSQAINKGAISASDSHATAIVQTAEKALNLINQWVASDTAISYVESPVRITPEELNKLINESIEHTQEAHPDSRFDIQLRHLEGVRGNSNLLGLTLRNILNNAATHGHADKPVTVQTRLFKHKLAIRIRDFGAGIAYEEQEKVFANFSREKQITNAGLGVGLYLIRRLILEIGGDIYFQSQPGMGTAMFIELPLAED